MELRPDEEDPETAKAIAAMKIYQDWLKERRATYDIDLGHDHLLRFFNTTEEKKAGAHVMHVCRDGILCEAGIEFHGPHAWTVESWEPLTISPSLLCKCGDHGFIREGKWVPA